MRCERISPDLVTPNATRLRTWTITAPGTQPLAQLIERSAPRHEGTECVGGESRVEQAAVEWHRADRMQFLLKGPCGGGVSTTVENGRSVESEMALMLRIVHDRATDQARSAKGPACERLA